MRCSGIINDEKGVAMPLALMVMVVLAMLGTTLWFYSVNDVLQVERDQNRTQAHYLAASGAEAMGQHIVSLSGVDANALINSLDGADSSKISPIIVNTDFLGYAGTMDVEVVRIEGNDQNNNINVIELTGIGEVDNVNQTNTLYLEYITMDTLFDGLVTNESLDLTSMTDLTGDLISSGTIAIGGSLYCSDNPGYYCPNVNGDTGPYEITEYAPFPYKSIPFNNISTTFEDGFTIGNGNNNVSSPVAIDLNRSIDSINVDSGNNRLIIDARGSGTEINVEVNELIVNGSIRFETNPERDINLYVNDKLEVKGPFEMDGFGGVNIYIRNFADLQTPNTILGRTDDQFLMIYLGEGSTLELAANAHITGYIYGPEATVKTHAQSKITGAVIAKSYEGKGSGGGNQNPSGNFIYKPYTGDFAPELDIGYRLSYWAR